MLDYAIWNRNSFIMNMKTNDFYKDISDDVDYYL